MKDKRDEVKPNIPSETAIEGRDAGPGEIEFSFPLEGETIVARSLEEAQAELERRKQAKRSNDIHEEGVI